MARDLDPTIRTMDGMKECPNCGDFAPYNPGKAGGRRCPACDSFLD